jgi:hypothetical protein
MEISNERDCDEPCDAHHPANYSDAREITGFSTCLHFQFRKAGAPFVVQILGIQHAAIRLVCGAISSAYPKGSTLQHKSIGDKIEHT